MYRNKYFEKVFIKNSQGNTLVRNFRHLLQTFQCNFHYDLLSNCNNGFRGAVGKPILCYIQFYPDFCKNVMKNCPLNLLTSFLFKNLLFIGIFP